MGLAEFFQDVHSVETRHHDVQEDQIEPMIPDQPQCGFAVGGGDDIVVLRV